MIKNINTDGKIFFAEINDMVTKEDVESVIPVVEKLIEKYQKIKCLLILDNVKGYTLGGFLADFNFYFKHKNAFGNMAIVGDKEFEKAMIELFDKLLPGKAKYFDMSEKDQAKKWIKQEN